jgi:hypothetical protein
MSFSKLRPFLDIAPGPLRLSGAQPRHGKDLGVMMDLWTGWPEWLMWCLTAVGAVLGVGGVVYLLDAALDLGNH